MIEAFITSDPSSSGPPPPPPPSPLNPPTSSPSRISPLLIIVSNSTHRPSRGSFLTGRSASVSDRLRHGHQLDLLHLLAVLLRLLPDPPSRLGTAPIEGSEIGGVGGKARLSLSRLERQRGEPSVGEGGSVGRRGSLPRPRHLDSPLRLFPESPLRLTRAKIRSHSRPRHLSSPPPALPSNPRSGQPAPRSEVTPGFPTPSAPPATRPASR